MACSSTPIRYCVLRSRSYKFRDIPLPDKIPTIVGRGPQTRIRDRKCSKSQIQIIANYETRSAKVVHLGSNPSEVNDKILVPQSEEEVNDGASINLLENDLKYTIEFLSEDPHAKPGHRHHSKLSPEKSVKRLKTGSLPPAKDENFSQALTAHSAQKDHDTSSGWKDEDIEESDTTCNVESEILELQKAVVNDFLSLSTEDRWEEYDHSKIFIFTPAGCRGKSKIAAFDLDHTIITTKSGKVFPTDTHDWQILYPDIPGRLKKLYEEGFKIVLFTNQKGISRGKTSASDFKKKVQRIIQKIGIPMQAIVSTGSGRYRKPNTGMWDYFVQKCNQGVAVDLNLSFFVGDAAGRPANWAPKKKKDFSCADRLFALNIGIKFYTPEEYFLNNKPATYSMPAFDPRHIDSAPLAVRSQPLPMKDLTADTMCSDSKEVIVFVGYPAAGKSYFAEMYLKPKGYAIISRDSLGSWQKCVAECSKALSSGRKVVVDNTNPDIESRSRYVETAKSANVPCRCFLFNCSVEQARHNNVYRLLMQPDDSHTEVNDMVLMSFKSKYKDPCLQEGFSEIVKVNFIPKFRSSHEELLFKRFLIEK